MGQADHPVRVRPLAGQQARAASRSRRRRAERVAEQQALIGESLDVRRRHRVAVGLHVATGVVRVDIDDVGDIVLLFRWGRLRSHSWCVPRRAAAARCSARSSTVRESPAGRRSSSSGLSHSGLPRQPREYFEGVEDPKLLELLAPTDPGAPDPGDPIPRALADGTTDNGVFAAKLMWTHLLDLAERLGRPADAALLREHFPDPRYVHVTRRDKVAQAVSLWRAVQTRAWRAGAVTENGDAVYHAGAIGYLAQPALRARRRVARVVLRQPRRAAHDRLRGARGRHERRHLRGARPPRRRAGGDPRAAAAPPGRRPFGALGGAVPHAAGVTHRTQIWCHAGRGRASSTSWWAATRGFRLR